MCAYLLLVNVDPYEGPLAAEYSLIIVGPPRPVVEDEVVVTPPAGLQLVVRGHGCQVFAG